MLYLVMLRRRSQRHFVEGKKTLLPSIGCFYL
nr:MAG TPA: hypothetical protein [Caudoviricetes sp.]